MSVTFKQIRKAKDKRDKLVCALRFRVQRTLAQVLVD